MHNLRLCDGSDVGDSVMDVDEEHRRDKFSMEEVVVVASDRGNDVDVGAAVGFSCIKLGEDFHHECGDGEREQEVDEFGSVGMFFPGCSLFRGARADVHIICEEESIVEGDTVVDERGERSFGVLFLVNVVFILAEHSNDVAYSGQGVGKQVDRVVVGGVGADSRISFVASDEVLRGVRNGGRRSGNFDSAVLKGGGASGDRLSGHVCRVLRNVLWEGRLLV